MASAPKSSICLVDDHAAVIAGLKQYVESQYGPESIRCTCQDGETLMEMLRKDPPDILVLDINIPKLDGLHCLELIRQMELDLKIIIYTTSGNRGVVVSCLYKEVDAYVLKDDPAEELIEAIREVEQGKRYFSSNIRHLVHKVESEIKLNTDRRLLTKREDEILSLLARGHNMSQIGEKLKISPFTAETHKKNILLKLGMNNTAELVRFAADTRRLDE